MKRSSTKSNSGPRVRFDAKQHRYFVGGRELPHATAVLKDGGLIKYLASDYYLERGRAVHALTHYADMKDLNWSKIDPEIKGYLQSYLKLKRDLGFRVLTSEKPVASTFFGIACTPDKTVLLHGQKAILELKSGAVEVWAALQTGCQEICLGGKWLRFGVELFKDGRRARIHPFTDPMDGQVFLSFLATYNWRKNHGYAVANND